MGGRHRHLVMSAAVRTQPHRRSIKRFTAYHPRRAVFAFWKRSVVGLRVLGRHVRLSGKALRRKAKCRVFS
jgi:hypothetical protein